jgi:hypothetical protein
LFATAQATAWHSRSTRPWSYVSMIARALRAREDLVQFLLLFLGDAFLDFGGGGHLVFLLPRFDR